MTLVASTPGRAKVLCALIYHLLDQIILFDVAHRRQVASHGLTVFLQVQLDRCDEMIVSCRGRRGDWDVLFIGGKTHDRCHVRSLRKKRREGGCHTVNNHEGRRKEVEGTQTGVTANLLKNSVSWTFSGDASALPCGPKRDTTHIHALSVRTVCFWAQRPILTRNAGLFKNKYLSTP